MRTPQCGITREGLPSIGLSAFAALVFAVMGYDCLPILFLLLTAFSCHFFRDPERVVPNAPGLGVSPADGKIVGIARKPDPFSGEERECVSIFMNVISVHVNRSPAAGRVTGIAYHAGQFLNAALDKASTDNERCAYQLAEESGQVWSFVQIAGLIARRIVCRVEVGDELKRGERFGMIKFGSRVDVYLPPEYKCLVQVGKQVFAGQTALAARREEA